MAVKRPLPILISIPHGGMIVPPKLRRFCRLNLADILYDGDTYSADLYAVEEEVESWHCFNLARAVVDLNRAPDDRPPLNPDGVVKTVTLAGQNIWKDPAGLGPSNIDYLLKEYYYPYHRRLEESMRTGRIELAIDCHTMLADAPACDKNAGMKRPLVCLSNRGDERGEEAGQPLTAPPSLLRELAHILEGRLKDIAAAKAPAVRLNDPFKGGYITARHGTSGNVPWIQVEFNRSLYLAASPERARPGRQTAARIASVRSCFVGALKELLL